MNDGSTTAATSTTLQDADRLIVNDSGTMVQVALPDFETYFEEALDTLSNVTTVGALNAGSITSGFGSINNGSSSITTTGDISAGTLSGDAIIKDIVETNAANKVYASNIIKDYVDATAEGLHILEPCLVGTNVRYAHSDVTTLPSMSVSGKTITTSSSYGSLNLKVGMAISGTNIQDQTIITGLGGGTTANTEIVLSKAPTGTPSNVTISHYSHNYTGYEAHSNLILILIQDKQL